MLCYRDVHMRDSKAFASVAKSVPGKTSLFPWTWGVEIEDRKRLKEKPSTLSKGPSALPQTRPGQGCEAVPRLFVAALHRQNIASPAQGFLLSLGLLWVLLRSTQTSSTIRHMELGCRISHSCEQPWAVWRRVGCGLVPRIPCPAQGQVSSLWINITEAKASCDQSLHFPWLSQKQNNEVQIHPVKYLLKSLLRTPLM